MTGLPGLRALCLLAVVTGGVGGCATMADVAGIAHPGHQPDGTYVLLASERELDCRGLNDEVELGLSDLKKTRARIDAERGTLPTTVVNLYGRVFGGPDGGLKTARAYNETEVRVHALNRQLAARNCHPIDVEARIKAFDLAPMQTAIQSPDATTSTGSIQRTSSSDLVKELEGLQESLPGDLKR